MSLVLGNDSNYASTVQTHLNSNFNSDVKASYTTTLELNTNLTLNYDKHSRIQKS